MAEETIVTTIAKETFIVSYTGGIFNEDMQTPVAHWDDNGIRFRVFKSTLVEAMSAALLQSDSVRIRVQGIIHENRAINMKDMTVESWMLE